MRWNISATPDLNERNALFCHRMDVKQSSSMQIFQQGTCTVGYMHSGSVSFEHHCVILILHGTHCTQLIYFYINIQPIIAELLSTALSITLWLNCNISVKQRCRSKSMPMCFTFWELTAIDWEDSWENNCVCPWLRLQGGPIPVTHDMLRSESVRHYNGTE